MPHDDPRGGQRQHGDRRGEHGSGERRHVEPAPAEERLGERVTAEQGISRCGDRDEPYPAAFFHAGPSGRPGEQRKPLQGMQRGTVRELEHAGGVERLGRQPRGAAGLARGARPDAEQARDREQAEPGAGREEHVGRQPWTLYQEPQRQVADHERDAEDQPGHDVVGDGVERRVAVEVAGHAPPLLHVDQRHLDDERGGRRPGEQAVTPPPGKSGPDPAQRQAGQPAGDPKENRLPPGDGALPRPADRGPHSGVGQSTGDEQAARHGQRPATGLDAPCGNRPGHAHLRNLAAS